MAKEEEDVTMEPVEMTPVDGGAYISERLRDPGAAQASASKPAANYTVAGIFAIIALISFIVMLALLYFDWEDLSVA
ncbi:MAG: hypothetical protein IJT64_04885 [Kiritimatiellae bacterium]|nr:hypothetical protein [Kiritimatiellia bacterium]